MVDLLEYLSLSLSLALQTDDFRDALVVIVSGMIFGARRFDKSSRLPCLSSYSLTQEAAPRARARIVCLAVPRSTRGGNPLFALEFEFALRGRLEYSDKFLSLSLSPTRGRREARAGSSRTPVSHYLPFLLSSESFFSPFSPCSRCRCGHR